MKGWAKKRSRLQQLARSLLLFLSRISIRLLAFNLLLVFLPVIGILSLKIYEEQLLEMQERSMVQQGRILAAALGGHGTLDGASAEQILIAMRQHFDARLQVVDEGYNLLADSSRLGPRREEVEPPESDGEVRENPLYRLGSFLYHALIRALLHPPEAPRQVVAESVDPRLTGREVSRALAGFYGRATRPSPGGQRSLTLYSALPIFAGDEVVGAVVVSKSTFQLLRSLYDLRLSMFKVILASIAAAVVLSLLVATTINRPLVRLRQEALAILDRRGRLKRGFRGSERRDEIGDLSRALAELTRRLESHLQFIESFAADVSHELKNPLAAIRNATELVAEVEDPVERQRFIAMVQRDIARLEHLLSGLRDITRIDAERDEAPLEEVDLSALLSALIERFELDPAGRVHYRLIAEDGPCKVLAHPERLSQVFENLLANATSFSPPDGFVTIRLETVERARILVIDQGPGIPEEHRQRVFDRFFSYRPEHGVASASHTGLGLAIVKAIVEGYGGGVTASSAPEGGAVLEVELPLADDSPR